MMLWNLLNEQNNWNNVCNHLSNPLTYLIPVLHFQTSEQATYYERAKFENKVQ